MAKVTICMSEALSERVLLHVKKREEKLTDFYNRAILNQLENEGDFEIRDLIEKECNNVDENQ